jgi:hypothetical protein
MRIKYSLYMKNPSLRSVTIAAVAVWSLAAAGNPANKLILQVEEKVHAALPTKAEKRFDEIGWAADIRTAERLARQHGRPILLFTHDGRINTGRC